MIKEIRGRTCFCMERKKKEQIQLTNVIAFVVVAFTKFINRIIIIQKPV